MLVEGAAQRLTVFVSESDHWHHRPVYAEVVARVGDRPDDAGARGATTTFSPRGIGDVLIAWENEAHLLARDIGNAGFAIVLPSLSIRAEPPVALVSRHADKHGGGWRRHDLLANQPVRLVEGTRVIEGVALGVDADGALRLRTEHGEHLCHAGEASLRAA